MGERPGKRHRLRFSLRHLFKVVTIVAILTGWAVWNWRRAHQRLEFLGLAGAVDGHQRTMKGYRYEVDRRSIKWLLFGDRRVLSIELDPRTCDDAYYHRLGTLFPEAMVSTVSPDH